MPASKKTVEAMVDVMIDEIRTEVYARAGAGLARRMAEEIVWKIARRLKAEVRGNGSFEETTRLLLLEATRQMQTCLPQATGADSSD